MSDLPEVVRAEKQFEIRVGGEFGKERIVPARAGTLTQHAPGAPGDPQMARIV